MLRKKALNIQILTQRKKKIKLKSLRFSHQYSLKIFQIFNLLFLRLFFLFSFFFNNKIETFYSYY